ncbi:longitudinals lacking protein, isoforms A/B/D/L-like [Diachasmimorpha longicaudata]|uniref:longitudinals lacking protein, isoforms A/B/D/L-like n=1 Tax=Diachasmimorpha longicaudata TaxID=58733 RepID=UPI0030B8F65A
MCLCKLSSNIPEIPPPVVNDWESNNSCPSCHKTFKHRCNLNTHVRYECGVPPRYNCPYCAKQAKHLTNARSHVKRCHPEREMKKLTAGQPHYILMTNYKTENIFFPPIII